ncbi:MAG: HdeD family acid-resistance protein [Thermoleophilaceae bacterium]
MQLHSATGAWWLVALVGLLSIAAGVIILFKPGDSLATLAVVAGVFLVMDAIVEVLAAITGATASRGLVALLGVLTLIVGVLLIRHPIQGVAAVALFIGLWLITVGVVRLVEAFETADHRGRRVFAASIEIVAGIVIVSSPNIGFATLALLAGIAFIVNGMGIFSLGWAMREVRHATVAPDHPPAAPA